MTHLSDRLIQEEKDSTEQRAEELENRVTDSTRWPVNDHVSPTPALLLPHNSPTLAP